MNRLVLLAACLVAILNASTLESPYIDPTTRPQEQPDCSGDECVNQTLSFSFAGYGNLPDDDCNTKIIPPANPEYEEEANKPQSPLIVKTEHGYIKGYYNHRRWHTRSKLFNFLNHNTPRAFVGIPFADPPVGDLRFRSPQPFSKPWNKDNPDKVRKTVHFGKACVQPLFEYQGEDCLYLNVFVPPADRLAQRGKTKNLPVIVWIYGGAYLVGSGNEFRMYDGYHITKHWDVIVVTFNYRLGPFGFMAVEGDGEAIEGNFGLEDQLLALKWAKRNIANFGGDPNNITLMGQSAGAYSVAALMGSKVVPRGLFQRAVMMSTPFSIYARTKSEMRRLGLEFAKGVGCVKSDPKKGEVTDIKCMRKVSAAKLLCVGLEGANRFNKGERLGDLLEWWPFIDGELLDDTPLNMLLNRPLNVVPTIIGTTRDEGGLFTSLLDTPIIGLLLQRKRFFSKDSLIDKVNARLQDKLPALHSLYPLSDDVKQNAQVAVRMLTEFAFTCPTVQFAAAASARQQVYVYEVTQPQSFLSLGMCNTRYICHASDLPLLWRPFFIPLGSKQKELSQHVLEHFIGFVEEGNVNKYAKDSPWLPYNQNAKNSTDGNYMHYGDQVQCRTGLRSGSCSTWISKLGFNW